MKNYFIHFYNSDQKVKIYEYLDDQLLGSSKNELKNLHEIIEPNSSLYVLLPSNLCITFSGIKHEGETHEQFKARFLMENEQDIISDISKNAFAFSEEMDLVLLADRDRVGSINQMLNHLGCEVKLIPEHYLLSSYAPEACFSYQKRYIFSFSDWSGFSVEEADLENYLQILKKQHPDFVPKCSSKNSILDKYFQTSEKDDEVSLKLLHQNFIKKLDQQLPNLYKKQFSFMSIYKRLELSVSELSFSLALLLTLIVLPILNLYMTEYYENQYRQTINQTFLSINPNFRRVINPRAQMDQMLAKTDTQQVRELDLSTLQYLRAISLDDISQSTIDFENSTLSIEFNELSRLKYAVIERLIQASDLRIIRNELITDKDIVTGSLMLELGNE